MVRECYFNLKTKIISFQHQPTVLLPLRPHLTGPHCSEAPRGPRQTLLTAHVAAPPPVTPSHS